MFRCAFCNQSIQSSMTPWPDSWCRFHPSCSIDEMKRVLWVDLWVASRLHQVFYWMISDLKTRRVREREMGWHAVFLRKKGIAYLLTAFQTILPSIIGTTWVKLKPESTTIVHSAGGRFGWENSCPYGIKDAAKTKWISRQMNECPAG